MAWKPLTCWADGSSLNCLGTRAAALRAYILLLPLETSGRSLCPGTSKVCHLSHAHLHPWRAEVRTSCLLLLHVWLFVCPFIPSLPLRVSLSVSAVSRFPVSDIVFVFVSMMDVCPENKKDLENIILSRTRRTWRISSYPGEQRFWGFQKKSNNNKTNKLESKWEYCQLQLPWACDVRHIVCTWATWLTGQHRDEGFLYSPKPCPVLQIARYRNVSELQIICQKESWWCFHRRMGRNRLFQSWGRASWHAFTDGRRAFGRSSANDHMKPRPDLKGL